MVAVVIILLLALLGVWFLPPREASDTERVIPDEPDTLYPETRDRRGVRSVPRERRLSREGNGSRSTERTRQLGENGEVGVEGDAVEPPDTER